MNIGRTTDTLFYNSQCLFVEYMDIIKVPWFVLLNLCRQNKKLRQILDMSPIEDLELNSLFEWYINRKNRNIFYELLINKSIDLSIANEIVKSQLEISPVFFETDTSLTIVPAMKKIIREGIIKDVVIYSEEYNRFMEEDIKKTFGKNSRISYRHGELKSVLNSIPIDTTYFFSDVEKVVALDDTDHLEFSSIVIPHEYRYNRNEKKEWNVDFEYLGKDKVFKLSFYNACLVKD